MLIYWRFNISSFILQLVLHKIMYPIQNHKRRCIQITKMKNDCMKNDMNNNISTFYKEILWNFLTYTITPSYCMTEMTLYHSWWHRKPNRLIFMQTNANRRRVDRQENQEKLKKDLQKGKNPVFAADGG